MVHYYCLARIDVPYDRKLFQLSFQQLNYSGITPLKIARTNQNLFLSEVPNLPILGIISGRTATLWQQEHVGY
jgi:hypothetical protein